MNEAFRIHQPPWTEYAKRMREINEPRTIEYMKPNLFKPEPAPVVVVVESQEKNLTFGGLMLLLLLGFLAGIGGEKLAGSLEE